MPDEGATPPEGAPEQEFDWSFTPEDAKTETSEQQPEGSETSEQQPAGEGGEYKLEWGEESAVPDYVRGDLAAVAKDIGVPAEQAAQLYERGLQAFIAQDQARMREAGQKLKQDWGNEFDAKIKAGKNLLARVAAQAGMTPEECKPMMSPMGFRFIEGLRLMMGESAKFAGKPTQTQALSPEAELDSIYKDPQKFAILSNPAHPEFEAVNARVNHLLGISR